MGLIALTDAFLHVDNIDYTTDTNAAALNTEVAQLDATTFNSGGWTEVAGGLKSVALAYSGFWPAGSAEGRAFSQLGASQVCTLGPIETEGSPAYMFQAMNSQYSLLGAVGDLAPFSVAANGTSGHGAIRGLLAKVKGDVDATGQLGTALNLGAVEEGQFLYATFHVFAPAGTTITIDLESDAGGAFPSPDSIATIGPLTTTGGTWVTRIPGPITDDWFRFNVTDIDGTFTVAGAIGIG